MTDPELSILIHLAHQGYKNAARGFLICMVYPEDRPHYESLLKLKIIKIKKTCVGETYRISKKGWKSLPRNVRLGIIKEYKDWVEYTRPTVKEPHWLKWLR